MNPMTTMQQVDASELATIEGGGTVIFVTSLTLPPVPPSGPLQSPTTATLTHVGPFC
jgi:hypothetical protein